MQRPFCIAFIALFLLTPACKRIPGSADYNARIGVAVNLGARICMAINNPKLLPAATITLVSPGSEGQGTPPETARAQILVRGAQACPGTKLDTALDTYNLEITSGAIQPNLPLVALDARVPSVYAAHSFHACTSNDGIHLTAWDGAKPLEGHRLWHQYYYEGRDLQPDCSAQETAP